MSLRAHSAELDRIDLPLWIENIVTDTPFGIFFYIGTDTDIDIGTCISSKYHDSDVFTSDYHSD